MNDLTKPTTPITERATFDVADRVFEHDTTINYIRQQVLTLAGILVRNIPGTVIRIHDSDSVAPLERPDLPQGKLDYCRDPSDPQAEKCCLSFDMGLFRGNAPDTNPNPPHHAYYRFWMTFNRTGNFNVEFRYDSIDQDVTSNIEVGMDFRDAEGRKGWDPDECEVCVARVIDTAQLTSMARGVREHEMLPNEADFNSDLPVPAQLRTGITRGTRQSALRQHPDGRDIGMARGRQHQGYKRSSMTNFMPAARYEAAMAQTIATLRPTGKLRTLHPNEEHLYRTWRFGKEPVRVRKHPVIGVSEVAIGLGNIQEFVSLFIHGVAFALNNSGQNGQLILEQMRASGVLPNKPLALTAPRRTLPSDTRNNLDKPDILE